MKIEVPGTLSSVYRVGAYHIQSKAPVYLNGYKLNFNHYY